jgi:sortase A
MNFRIKQGSSRATLSQYLIRWSRRLLLTIGTLSLAYVSLTLVDARLYQVSAKRSLEIQMKVWAEPKKSFLKLPVKEGDVLGRMDIPRLGLSVAVLEGTNARTLRLGAGHIQETSRPGEAGNIGIAGHRDTFFRDLRDIRKNDEIQLQTASGLVRYEVDWIEVVTPDEISVLAPSSDSVLTLVTCYPFQFVGSAPKRFIVRAHKYQPPA